MSDSRSDCLCSVALKGREGLTEKQRTERLGQKYGSIFLSQSFCPNFFFPLTRCKTTRSALTLSSMICSTLTDKLPHRFEKDDSFTGAFLAYAEHCFGARQTSPGNCIRVVDIGTGTARIPIDLCSRRDDIRLTAVDRAARALRSAQRKIANAGLSHAVQVIRADAHSLPFADGEFDALISNSLLHHVANRLGVLNEFRRVLRLGGLLFLRDTLKGPDADRIDQILRISRRTSERRQAAFETPSPVMLTLDETRDLAAAAGIPRECVRQSGQRHWVLAFRV